MNTILTLIAVGFVVIQIIIIVKFFQIAADTRAIRDQYADLLKLLGERFAPETGISKKTDIKPSERPVMPKYTEGANNQIVFEDGLSGTITVAFGSFGFKNQAGKLQYFSNKEEAIAELYMDLVAQA